MGDKVNVKRVLFFHCSQDICTARYVVVVVIVAESLYPLEHLDVDLFPIGGELLLDLWHFEAGAFHFKAFNKDRGKITKFILKRGI